jgi:hypothetical protein
MVYAQQATAQGNDKRGPVDISLYWISREQWAARRTPA